MKVQVRQYYLGFVSLYGIMAGIPFIPPLLHVFMPDSTAFAEYLYPPLGDIEWIAVAATISILLSTTFVVFTCCQSARKIYPAVPTILTIGSILSVCVLIALYVPYVRHIPVHSLNLDVPVSIGYQRTNTALQAYPQWSDWAMLQDAGPREEQIQKLWTQRSICIVRVLLWFFHTLTLTCFISVVSLAVYQDAAEKVPIGSEDPKTAAQ
ncbi:MAG: hypothetical protein WAN35_02975 [Terracidiphilus sp.]